MNVSKLNLKTDIPKRERPQCGAKTRSGHPCKAKAVKGKNRCRMHGGLSTGAKTREGIERIKLAQQKRWKRYRRNILR